MNRTTLLLGAAALLAGCATPPDKVLSSDARTIRLEWRPWQVSEGVVRGHALLYCNGYPIEEVQAEASASGLKRAKTWRCVGA
jgi:hypothetical protein